MTAMNDDWKGEHLIHHSTTDAQKKSEVRRLVSKIYHENRRAAGVPAPAAKKHRQLIRAVMGELTRTRKENDPKC